MLRPRQKAVEQDLGSRALDVAGGGERQWSVRLRFAPRGRTISRRPAPGRSSTPTWPPSGSWNDAAARPAGRPQRNRRPWRGGLAGGPSPRSSTRSTPGTPANERSCARSWEAPSRGHRPVAQPLNADHTSAAVATAMWDAVLDLGFDGNARVP